MRELYRGYKLPANETAPDIAITHALAETYHISPLEVEQWSMFDRNRYITLLGLQNEGRKYQEWVNSKEK